MTDESRWPLEGVKVLDLGQIYNGPYAGFLLAHAGADVVKVEPLGGEVLRRRGGGLGTPFSLTMLNTKKRGLSSKTTLAEMESFVLMKASVRSNFGSVRGID